MTSELPMKEKGVFLEDMVADIFRNWGFDVELRIKLKDKYDVPHEIDVLASKKEPFGIVKVAIECKYVKSPIGIEAIRNFQNKLSVLGITKGIFVSTAGFTSIAKSHAKALGIDVWDLATLQKKVSKIKVPEKERMNDALSPNPSVVDFLLPSHLKNGNLLQVSDLPKLSYHPFYLVDFHCFSQRKAGGTIVNLESKGIIAINATNGEVYDSFVSLGLHPAFPKSGVYVDCSPLSPTTIFIRDFPETLKIKPTISLIPPKITLSQAKSISRREIAKHLSLKYSYWVGKRKRSKILRPLKKDIEITDCRFFNIPILSFDLKFKDKKFHRTVQAATNKIIRDETRLCMICREPSVLICEKCGTIVCGKHSKQCISCGKNLCNNCIISKGFIFKKYYCPECAPK